MKQLSIVLFFAALTAAWVPAAAQVNGRSLGEQLRSGKKAEKKANSTFAKNTDERASITVRTFVENKNLRTADRWTADTVYFKGAERLNSWIVGIGEPLEKRPEGNCFMLTRRNPAGHYLRAEFLGKNAIPRVFRSEFINDKREFDYNRSPGEEWLELENDIVRLDFTPSGDGERVQIEHAFSSDGTLVHTMTLERVDKDRAVGFYSDHKGDILTLADPLEYIAPTGIIFEYETDGRFKSITPIDATGWPISIK